jgi:transposase
VFGLSRALQVWVYTEPTDMRKSFNTLSALVTEEMGREVLSSDLFVFISRDRKRAKSASLRRHRPHRLGQAPGARSVRASLSIEA